MFDNLFILYWNCEMFKKTRKIKCMEDKEFLIKKVEILESAIKQIAVIQYELSKKLGELEGLE